MDMPAADTLAPSAATRATGATLFALTAGMDAVAAPLLVHRGACVLHANPAMLRLLGQTLPALRALDFDAWVDEDHRATVREQGLRCLDSDDELPVIEALAVSASGSLRAVELSQRRLTLAPLRPLALLTAQDLSDIRHVQQSLMEMGQMLRQILDAAPLPTLVIDAQHRITHWNAACARLTGLQAWQVLGRSEALARLAADDAPALASQLVDGAAARQDGRGNDRAEGSAEEPAPTPDALETEAWFPQFGEGRWLHVYAAPLHDSEGRVVGAIQTLQDVTARRSAEEALRRHQQELEALVAARSAELLATHRDLESFLDNAPVAIAGTEGLRVMRGNRTLHDTFDLAAGAAEGLAIAELFPDDAAFQVFLGDSGQRLAQDGAISTELAMKTARGRDLWVQLIAYGSDGRGVQGRVWWLLQDRSEVLRAQQELVQNFRHLREVNARLEEAQGQLLQSEKLASIGQLAAGVAHEINNPIGFVSSNFSSLRRYVQGLLHLLRCYAEREPADWAADPALQQAKDLAEVDYVAEDLPELLSESEEGLGRVRKIVQDLKDFSRVDQADWQDADLNQGVESTLNVVMNEVKYRAEVRRAYGALPPVRCLAAQLNQVFMNLIVNAAHAMDRFGVLTLASGVEDGWAWVSVSDDGRGMSAEVIRRIFEPFYTTKPVGQGTGLGLSLSFSIVKKHGGHIDVVSTPGQGSCFTVWVPVAGPEAAPPPPPALQARWRAAAD
jgi:two-component system, NtrC family, sensor kinase